jgi:exosome complex component RRP43
MEDHGSIQPGIPASPLSLSFPRATFAKLSPRPYLQAHLSPSDKAARSTRPSGRRPEETRPPTIQLGSLTHANGSAVIRIGDTAVVCGIRAEILHTRDIPGFRQKKYDPEKQESHDEVRELGLLVPNIELATGCSPQNLPGSPPSALAQSLSMRLLTLLYSSKTIDPDSLQIWHRTPDSGKIDDDSSEEEVEETIEPTVKGFWTLYIDMLFISFDGNAFDAAWASLMAALYSTKLPRAQWNADADSIICSPLYKTKPIQLLGFPISSTFAVFDSTAPTQTQGTNRQEKKRWLLADPDMFEEGLCDELVTIVVDYQTYGGETPDSPKILRIEKRGGGVVGKVEIRDMLDHAGRRWLEWRSLLNWDDH